MVLFIIFCPIMAAILIMAGAPARKTALAASILAFAAALFLLVSFDSVQHDFQHVTSFTISPEWHLSFTTGIDGLSLVMILLATIVTLAAVWFTGTIERYENAFYACLLFVSGGAIGAFASIDLFFFYAFHELALIPTFLLIGIWGSGNRVAAAWKITIYLAIGSFILLLGLILLYQSFPASTRSFDIRALTAAAGLGQIGADAAPCLPGVAYWFWNSYLTLSIPHLGSGSVCLGPSASGDAACRCVKKIWLVRSVASGSSFITRRIASLGWSACGPIAR